MAQAQFLARFQDHQRCGTHTSLTGLLTAARQVGDANDPEEGNLFTFVVRNAKDPNALLPVLAALIEGGAHPNDDCLAKQLHDRAINRALRKKSYALVTKKHGCFDPLVSRLRHRVLRGSLHA